jgi:AGZA family xanthine/uracil permease-like MFS transporter
VPDRDIFRIRERGSTVRAEVLGGVTTFATMAYIIVVNPAILSFAGLPTGPSTVATILAAAFGSILMGLYANRPFAVAPYMGENAFIAFGLAAFGITWQQRLGAVFWGGLLFAVITALGVRPWLAAAISPSLKHSFAVAIGLFLALIGLYESGVVTSFVTGMPPAALPLSATGTLLAPGAPLKLGETGDTRVLLAIAGFALMAILLQRGVRAAILIGMAVTAALGLALGFGAAPQGLVAVPFRGEYSLGPVALQLDLVGVLRPSLLPVLMTLFLMGFLDTLATLVALGAAASLLDEDGNLPQIERPMMVDAAASMFGGLIGTSTTGAYIESATGIRDGARTGLAAVTTGVLFLGALFFLPLFAPLQALRYAYAPALVIVGVLMTASARHIAYDDLTELVPAFATITLVVFTYNIANGLSAGLALYPVVKVAAGRMAEVRTGAWVLAAMSPLYFIFGLPH